jgi:hypothetical protein
MANDSQIVVDVPNVGPVAFPAAMPPQDILQAVRRIAGDKAAQQEQERLAGPPLTSGTANRFVQGLAQTLNPVSMVTAAAHAVIPEAVARMAGAERPETYGPLNTLGAIGRAQVSEWNKSNDPTVSPTALERYGHRAAALLPVVGPAAAHAGERIASGDVAGGLGESVGLIAPTVAEGAMRMTNRPNPMRATAMERQAVEDVANQVLNPANAKMRGTARFVAPEMLKKSSGYTGERMMDTLHAEDMMDAAVAKIDDALQATGGGNTPVDVTPILDSLQRKLDELMTTRRDKVGKKVVVTKVPMKGNEGQVDHLQSIINEINGVSSGVMGKGTKTAYFDELKPLRDNYYAQAKKAGAYRKMGNVTLDDAGWAAREGGTAIQDAFANTVPELADANKEYHLHKSIHEVLNPLEGNPRPFKNSQGQTGGLATVGFAIGQNFGKAGAFIGSKMWPQLVEVMNSPKFKFVSAQNKMELAQAIRSGQPGRVQRAIFNVTRAMRATSATEAAQEQP